MAVLHLPQPGTAHRRGLSTTLGLLRLEVRRNIGLLCFPLLVALGVSLARARMPQGVWIWSETSIALREPLMLLGPLMAGVAAWMAARTQRCRIDELLTTTPHSPTGRNLVLWAGTMVWGLLAYAIVAAGLLTVTAQRATWGAPAPAPIIQGALAVVAYATLGYAIGCYLPFRLTTPLVAVGMYVLQYVPVLWYGSPLLYLSPFMGDGYSFDYAVERGLGVPRALWLLGLGLVGLAAICLREQRTLPRWGAMFGALLITMTSVVLLAQVPRLQAAPPILPYEPVCAQGEIEVCVHEAYAAVLPDAVTVVEAVTRPLRGIPGAPTRAEQQPGGGELLPDGTITFQLYHAPKNDAFAVSLARGLAVDTKMTFATPSNCINASCPAEGNYPQGVLTWWLEGQSGFMHDQRPRLDGTGQAALDRFMALDSSAQRQWLEQNFAALRAGQLTLEDLP